MGDKMLNAEVGFNVNTKRTRRLINQHCDDVGSYRINENICFVVHEYSKSTNTTVTY